MKGNLADAPEWATHYIESKNSNNFWFVNFNNYRWTVTTLPDKEYLGRNAEMLVMETKIYRKRFLVIELNFILENE